MPIELLYFDGCPSHERYLPHLRRLLAGSSHGSELALRRVESREAAEGERFLGSPSVRVDGFDIEPGADLRTDFGLTCRLYPTLDGLPADAWVFDALDRAGREPQRPCHGEDGASGPASDRAGARPKP